MKYVPRYAALAHSRRTPRGVRGLKYFNTIKRQKMEEVAPREGCVD